MTYTTEENPDCRAASSEFDEVRSLFEAQLLQQPASQGPVDPQRPLVQPITISKKVGSSTSLVIKNAAINVLRIGLTSIVGILLPSYLTHHLPLPTYSAWVLILQLGAYVSYLNLGVQTALSKFIAEYDAKGDQEGCSRCATAGLRIMLAASILGLVLTGVLATHVSRLFHDMPASLSADVSLSVWLIGISLSVGLSSSVFSAIFLGLQRYQVPTIIGITSRLLYGAVVCAAVFFHASLITMAAAAAVINLLTALFEVLAWLKLAGTVRVSLFSAEFQMLRKMLAYCSILTVWSACMLFISGLDITIVGHYAFRQVAFYSVANAPTALILTIIGALLGPLLPATSAYSVRSTAQQMGDLLLRTTRYATILILATGLPILVGGYLLLSLWVGSVYAIQSILFLHVLLLANILRNLCLPYSTMVIATSRQHVGTAAAVTEALVNLVCSISLAQHFGAIGVAVGTLIGALAGVAMHFGVSMHYTRINFNVSRTRLFLAGIVRPSAMALPTIVLIPRWWISGVTVISPSLWLLWLAATAGLTWFVSMTRTDRALFTSMLQRRLVQIQLVSRNTHSSN